MSAPQPCQQVQYLGVVLDSARLWAALLEPRQTALQQAVLRLQWGVALTALTVMQEFGLMAAGHPAVPLGLLHMCHLQRWLASLHLDPQRHKHHLVNVPLSVQEDLHYLGSPQHLLADTPLGQMTSCIAVFTDASLTGCGGAPVWGEVVCGLQGKTNTSTSSNFRWCSWFSNTSCLWFRGDMETRQPHHSRLHQQAGWSQVRSPVEDSGEPVGVALRTPSISESPPCSGSGEQGRRPHVEGQPFARRVGAASQVGVADLELVRESGPVRQSKQHPLPTLVLPDAAR